MTTTTTTTQSTPPSSGLRGLSRNVIVLGWVSFLTDLASEMLYPVMPLFVVGTLGGSPPGLRLIDGVAEGISSGLRGVTGALSDRPRRRKPFVVGGYTISALSKPVMGLAAFVLGWPLFFVGRCSDRLGKSVRTAARDALIVDSTDPAQRGAAFGLHRAMDTAGAVVGPLTVLLILTIAPPLPLAWLFFVALVPGLASAALAAVALRDRTHEPHADAKPPPIIQRYPRSLWHLIVANAVFSLGNSSDSFLILRSKELGLTFRGVVLAFAIYNAVYALTSWPLGSLSDRVGRKWIIACGWLVYALVYLGFATTGSSSAPWALLTIYGLYQALTEGVTKALIGDVADPDQRAGAIGLFYTVSGAEQLAASVLAGSLWSMRVGHFHAAFTVASVCAVIAAAIVAKVQTPDPT